MGTTMTKILLVISAIAWIGLVISVAYDYFDKITHVTITGRKEAAMPDYNITHIQVPTAEEKVMAARFDALLGLSTMPHTKESKK